MDFKQSFSLMVIRVLNYSDSFGSFYYKDTREGTKMSVTQAARVSEEGTFWQLVEGEGPLATVNSPERCRGQTEREVSRF